MTGRVLISALPTDLQSASYLAGGPAWGSHARDKPAAGAFTSLRCGDGFRGLTSRRSSAGSTLSWVLPGPCVDSAEKAPASVPGGWSHPGPRPSGPCRRQAVCGHGGPAGTPDVRAEAGEGHACGPCEPCRLLTSSRARGAAEGMNEC